MLAAIVGLTCMWAQTEGRSLLWRDQVSMEASALGANHALRDFRADKLRIFELDGPSEHNQPTGRRDGPFEVWRSFYIPEMGETHRWEREHYIATYNSKMRYMQAHPAKFRAKHQPQAAERR